MNEGRQEQLWQHTSSILAMIHNVNCSKKSQQKDSSKFNPMLIAKFKEPLSKKETTAALKSFLKVATKGKFREQKIKYVLDDQGRYVPVDIKEVVK